VHINSWPECDKIATRFRNENLVDPDAPWMVDVAQPKFTLFLAFMKIHSKCSNTMVEEDDAETDEDAMEVDIYSYSDNVRFVTPYCIGLISLFHQVVSSLSIDSITSDGILNTEIMGTNSGVGTDGIVRQHVQLFPLW